MITMPCEWQEVSVQDSHEHGKNASKRGLTAVSSSMSAHTQHLEYLCKDDIKGREQLWAVKDQVHLSSSGGHIWGQRSYRLWTSNFVQNVVSYIIYTKCVC